MHVIIAGSRCPFGVNTLAELHWYERQWAELRSACVEFQDKNGLIESVLSGHARGVDALGERWSREKLGRAPVLFPADWGRYGRSAGMVRNRQMAEQADGLIALWDLKSSGTSNMIEEARRRDLKVLVWEIQHGVGTLSQPL